MDEDTIVGSRKRRLVRQSVVDGLSRDESLVAAARREDHAQALAGRKIAAVVVDGFDAGIQTCRGLIARIEAGSASGKGVTRSENDLRDDLLLAFEEIQTGATQELGDDEEKRPRLTLYAVNAGIRRMDRPTLEQAAQTALDALNTDTDLPGVTPAKVATFSALLTAWKAADGVQQSVASDTGGLRRELTKELEKVAAARRKIHLAADAEWPHRKVENKPIRAEFGLPTTRPLPK